MVDKISSLSERMPPQNIEAEQCVLGGILLENEAFNKVIEIMKPHDFYLESHRKICDGMLELFAKNDPIDLISLNDILEKKSHLDGVGGVSYLASLVDNVPTAANIAYYAKIVREKSLLRKLINTATEIATQAYNFRVDARELLDYSENAIFKISENQIRPSFFSLKEIIKGSFKNIEELYEKKKLLTGIPTGFEEIDKLTSGLQASELIIIAGRPSMGKTAFSLDIARHAASEADITVAFFSLEMSRNQIGKRLLSSEAKVDSHKLRGGFLEESDWPKLAQATGALAEIPLFIDDTPALSVLEMKAKARRLKSEHHNLGLIIVDYLQLMRGEGFKDSREQEISNISSSLKALAKELDLPVVALSQLNRRVEDRQDKRPQLADLRESGAIEQDADVVAFIYRDEVYNKSPDNPNKGIAEVIIGKQRNGPVGNAKLVFLDKYTSFANWYPQKAEY